MKVITQLIDFFQAQGLLTQSEIAKLARSGFCGEHDFFEPEEVVVQATPLEEEGDLEHLQKDLEAKPSLKKKKPKRGREQARRLFHRARNANKQLTSVG